jgi:predicted RNA binding protein YcfA (HicA-like mRNA interferase family)
MPRFGPISRAELIRYLRQAGFTGPYPGGRHSFMTKGDQRLTIPNPHRGDISVPLLAEILRKAGVARDDWERL